MRWWGEGKDQFFVQGQTFLLHLLSKEGYAYYTQMTLNLPSFNQTMICLHRYHSKYVIRMTFRPNGPGKCISLMMADNSLLLVSIWFLFRQLLYLRNYKVLYICFGCPPSIIQCDGLDVQWHLLNYQQNDKKHIRP